MKKLKIFAVLFFLICTMAIFGSCGEKLDAPTGVLATEETEIVWSPTKNAYRYLVQFKDVDNGATKELKSKDNKIAVADFELEEGWYDVRVKALSGEGKENDSDWSTPLRYYKIYESGCTFTLVNNVEYHVTGSAKAKGDVRIEATYNGKPVTRIAESAFKANTRITSVKIGEFVEEIDKNAFYGCSQLKSVSFPEKLKTIGASAFQSCRELTDLQIPEQVTLIDEFAFGYCRKLKSVSLGKSLRAVGASAFYGCSVLEKIALPDSVEFIGEKAFSNCEAMQEVSIGAGITEIGTRTFYENTALASIKFAENIKLEMIGDLAFGYATKVKKIQIPEGVEYLGDGAFQGCEELYDITIPSTLTHIGAYAFGGTKYYKGLVDDPLNTLYYLGNWLIGAQEDEDDSDAVDLSFKGPIVNINPETFNAGTVGIADLVLQRCPLLNKVVLPDSIKYIGDYAFYQCPQLNLVYTNYAETVGDYAFAEDANISQLTLGTKLKSIGAYAFFKCASLENNSQNPIVPESVTRIGTYAFANSGLWKKPEEGVIYAGSWAVGYVDSITEAVIRRGTVGISDYAFYMASSLLSVTGLGESVKHIGRGAFFGCTRLGTITLCDDMEEIADYTFYGCANLLNVSLPQSLKVVGRSAFYDCEMLSELDFSEVLNFEEIGMYAFMNCRNLTSVDFGYTLKNINDYAFYKCYSLEEVALPDTLERIGNYAFYNNYYAYEDDQGEYVQKGLKTVLFDKDPNDKYESKLKTIGNYAFTGCQLLDGIFLPDSVEAVGTSAFYHCFAVQTVELGENLKTIGDYAFFGLEKVNSLKFPETVKSIGVYAFKGWNGLTSIVLPKTLQIIDEHAFYGCKNATVYTECTPSEVNWDIRWNSSYRPVVFGARLSEDKSYVVSLTVNADTFLNLRAEGGLGAPVRANYEFKGWALTENGEVAYTAENAHTAPVGSVLYAKWTEIVAEQP